MRVTLMALVLAPLLAPLTACDDSTQNKTRAAPPSEDFAQDHWVRITSPYNGMRQDPRAVIGWTAGADIAVLYDRLDPVVSTGAVRDLLAAYGAAGLARPPQRCVYNFTMHSMLSMYDDVGQNKWWLPSVACAAVGFLADGSAFPVAGGADDEEGGERFCDVGCTEASCPPYVRTTDAPPPPITC